MDCLEEITSKLSNNGSSLTLQNSSLSLNEHPNLNNEDSGEIIGYLSELADLFKKTQAGENTKSYFMKNEGLTLLEILFTEVSWDNNEVAQVLLKILNYL